ncbi:chromate transporter [Ktedonosporobacter rubrisoli]|uniref:Chromate transporter n=1 Tax=Ktedonosporobacter rubrisoli TaxID=2509675 RepID=A0A4P6JYZ2_KTERU|nr:chromate transporter [Ktedonosporobacter rubrisoli]QBD80977.1 chromate transporter [Ktedonosporobacter rubrisoli]
MTHSKPPASRPGVWQLLRIWGSIGLQSFGGGASTTFLIQDAFIEKYGWLTEEDFSRLWNLSLFTPGINLVAMTALIGRRLGGLWGMLASLLGLLLPSATITCLLTAGFTLIEHFPAVQAILRGVVPATAGIMLLVAIRFAAPQFELVRKEGLWRQLASVLIILGCALAIIVWQASVILVLLAASLAGIAIFTPWQQRPGRQTSPRQD